MYVCQVHYPAPSCIGTNVPVRRQERNLHYVFHIEVFLAKAFGSIPVDDEDEPMYA